MNGKDKYEAIIEQAEQSKSVEERQKCIISLWKLFLTNDLPHMYAELQMTNKKFKKLVWMGMAILLAILFQDQIGLTAIIGLISKIL